MTVVFVDGVVVCAEVLSVLADADRSFEGPVIEGVEFHFLLLIHTLHLDSSEDIVPGFSPCQGKTRCVIAANLSAKVLFCLPAADQGNAVAEAYGFPIGGKRHQYAVGGRLGGETRYGFGGLLALKIDIYPGISLQLLITKDAVVVVVQGPVGREERNAGFLCILEGYLVDRALVGQSIVYGDGIVCKFYAEIVRRDGFMIIIVPYRQRLRFAFEGQELECGMLPVVGDCDGESVHILGGEILAVGKNAQHAARQLGRGERRYKEMADATNGRIDVIDKICFLFHPAPDQQESTGSQGQECE